MRVLLVTGSYPPMRCGIGDYSYRLAKSLAADPTIRVAVLTSVDAEKVDTADEIAIFPVIKYWGISEASRIIKSIWTWSPDIVHIQYPTQGYGSGFLPWILPILAFLMGKKVVQTWHETYARRSAPKLFLKAIVPGGLVVVRPQYRDILSSSLSWAMWNKRYTFIRNASPFKKMELVEEEKESIRKKYLNGGRRLIVFFGFVYPNKGAEFLFEIANPNSDRIVIAGEIVENSEYQQKILGLASKEPWVGKVTVTGFLPPTDIAALLTVADAVVLPYRIGGGEWNTSIHAAVLQGSFVITTSSIHHGYDEMQNIFFAKVDDVQEMKSALDVYAGTRRKFNPDIDNDEWKTIAVKHRSLYETLLNG